MAKKSAIFLMSTALWLPLVSTTFAAKEPANLYAMKLALKNYHDSGAYDKALNDTIQTAINTLKARLLSPNTSHGKLAMVLDIDETSLSNYGGIVRQDFGGTKEEIRAEEDKGDAPAIMPTLQLYRFAKAHHVAVFFITGREENERQITAANLMKAGYTHWDGLILRYGPYLLAPAEVYKTTMRKKITEAGYDIVLNIGDQQSDLMGHYADNTFKLSNPYYFIP